ncbi:hypothetical protein GZH47_32170 (plasmid) [Paenibacillus rhizovicinus]|uniref:Uncharacterized protein n=1 Tax=Paenibacillus rhizovicinus TaxID=2704463 RepID=A0A6C0PAE4_9BACL|nr:hypothetical protein [Paenibacillus rhizovicinus]QHW35544.1 hypothetical protein GZH47_32170 [Paenibacillus rhizovicinus]
MVAIKEQEIAENDMVRIEMEFTASELRQLISQLPTKHPLLARLRRQLEASAAKEEGMSPLRRTLTYLSEKLNVSSVEHLFSKTLSFIHWGVELEDKGFEIMAVKRGFFSKEVIHFKIRG